LKTTTADWKTSKLDQLGFLGRGKSKHRPRNDPSLYGGEYPFFQTGDIKAANLYLTEYTQTYNETGLAQSKLWDPGTLCITIAANIAETAILGIRGCFPDSVVGFIAEPEKADVRFIKYYIDTIKLEMQGISRGTTQDNLSLDKLLTFEFLVPPLSLQRRIAGILSAYDELIENNQRRIKILEEMARSLYREWFVNFRFPGHEKVPLLDSPLGKIPKGWEVCTVAEVIQRIPSGKKYDQKTVQPEGGVPVLDQGKSGIIGYHDDEPGVIASEVNPVIVFANHTCYQRMIHFPFSTIQNVLPFVPSTSRPRNIYWLHSATNGLVVFNDYKGHWPEFVSKKVILPGDEVCNPFGDYAAPIARMILNSERTIQNLRRARDLLLPRLLSGSITFGDLTTEPDGTDSLPSPSLADRRSANRDLVTVR
jgi:type I restriction enzyme S subunit